MKQISDCDLAYIAGLIDGEGCLFAYEQATRYGGRTFVGGLRVKMVHPNAVTWACQITGLGNLRYIKRPPPRQAIIEWHLRLKECDVLLPQLLQYLHVKQQEAWFLLQFITDTNHDSREYLVKQLHRLNQGTWPHPAEKEGIPTHA